MSAGVGLELTLQTPSPNFLLLPSPLTGSALLGINFPPSHLHGCVVEEFQGVK